MGMALLFGVIRDPGSRFRGEMGHDSMGKGWLKPRLWRSHDPLRGTVLAGVFHRRHRGALESGKEGRGWNTWSQAGVRCGPCFCFMFPKLRPWRAVQGREHSGWQQLPAHIAGQQSTTVYRWTSSLGVINFKWLFVWMILTYLLIKGKFLPVFSLYEFYNMQQEQFSQETWKISFILLE